MKINRTDLLPSQIQLLDAGFLESDSSWVICAPTGAGKTRMGEWVLQKAAVRGRKGVYLAPLKAIVEEKCAEWGIRYPELEIGLYTGETTRNTSKKHPTDEHLLLMTSEKLGAYLHMWKRHLDWLSQIDVVVIDEFHLLSDPNRGPTVEALIGRLQRINPFIRFVCLSATVPNSDRLARWLNGTSFVTSWRPVPLSHRVVFFKKADEKPELLEKEVFETVRQEGQVLVFVNSRRRCERLSDHLDEAGFKAAYYHAGLGMVSRTTRQTSMKNREIDVLVSTSSLEMGVNFPARKVVVYDSFVFTGDGFGPLPIGRYQQFAGRAGRLGLDTQGESVIFLPRWHKDGEKYITGGTEPVVSGFHTPRRVMKEVLTEVCTRLSISKGHLRTNFSERTFWHASEGSRDLSHLVDKLIETDLLAQGGKGDRYLTQTPLGRIATQMDVSPETILTLVQFYRKVPGPSLFDCILAVCLCPELTPRLPFNFENTDVMGDMMAQVSSSLLDSPPSETLSLMSGKNKSRGLLSALKTATVLMQHTSGETLEMLSELFDCYPTDITMIKRNADWILATADRVFSFLWKQQWEKEKEATTVQPRPLSTHEYRVNSLIPMVKYGLPRQACELLKLKGIGPKRAMRLYEASISTLGSFAETPNPALSEVIGLNGKIVSEIKKNAAILVTEKAQEIPFELWDDPIPAAPQQAIHDWPQGVDPYRLRRALDLKIVHRSGECIQVEGGTEPHMIRIGNSLKGNRNYHCDCMDAAKGRLCKHTMRARLECGDGRELLKALRLLSQKGEQPLRYALADLWMQTGNLYDRYEERNPVYDGRRFLDRATASTRWNR